MMFHDKTITVLNRLHSKDALDHKDSWSKTIIHDCGWYTKSIASMKDANAVVMGKIIKVLIPFNTGYTPYNEWISTGVGFTMSQDDYIVLGEITEEVTANNIMQIVQKYKPDICTVKIYRYLDKRVDNTIELYVEGV